MIVSILPHSLRTVQPSQLPAVVLTFIKQEKIIRVIGYPKEEYDVTQFTALFEEITGLTWDGRALDWQDYNESLMNSKGMTVGDAVA